MPESLEERLRDHAKAFDSLLSLIPAKLYYGEDTSDQWQKKKQSKEEKRNAKLAKLDPTSAKSVKDVMDERARKRKRDEDDESSERECIVVERPREGLKQATKKSKKSNREDEAEQKIVPGDIERDATKSEGSIKPDGAKTQQRGDLRVATKLEMSKAKKQAKKDKREKKKQNMAGVVDLAGPSHIPSPSTIAREIDDDIDIQEGNESDSLVDGKEQMFGHEGLNQDAPGDGGDDTFSTATTSSAPESPAFDEVNLHSTSSSISSIIPPATTSDTKEEKDRTSTSEYPSGLKLHRPDSEELKQRLQKRIEELRAARKADGLGGKPARNRQELIEARRQKEEQRKAHKRELRRKAKDEEQRKQDEALARRFSPASGSLLASPRSPASEYSNNFSFGRVAFADGQQTDSGLSSILEQRKRKGPQDPLGALKAAQSKEARLSNYDESKRADIQEKDLWLNAKKHAHGERIRDDTSLLKKALKRKDSAKRKSEKEWTDRIEGVRKGQEIKQNRREENLRKRKEERGMKGKKAGKAKKGKSRPGFEGSFKARGGGGGRAKEK